MDGGTLQPNIARAIRRARGARAQLRARRRRMAALAACACLGVAVPLSMIFADFSGSDAIAAVSGGAQNLLDMLDQRSPGARTEAQLTKTKRHERALARMRGAPHVPAAAPVPAGQPELAAILMDVPQPLPVELAAAPLAVAVPALRAETRRKPFRPSSRISRWSTRRQCPSPAPGRRCCSALR